MKKTLKKRVRTKIPDLDAIKKQFEAGMSILALSDYWDIPYATLYRALKSKSKKQLTASGPSSGKK